MERKIIYETFSMDRIPTSTTHTQIGFQALLDALKDGWILDPTMYQSAGRAQPLRLENTVIYHLIKYTEEELKELEDAMNAAEPGEETLVDVISVDFDDVKDKLANGYVVHHIYQKNVILKKPAEVTKENDK